MSELPIGWCEATIADVTSPFVLADPTKAPTTLFKYVDIGSIDNKTQTIANPKVIKGADAPSRARRVIHTGDTLFSTVRTYLKNIALVPDDLDGQLTSTGISVLRPNEAVNPRYLFTWTCSDRFVEAISVTQDGTMYPAVSDRDVADGIIRVPPVPEQGRIVAKINSLSVKSKRARENLDHIPRLVEKYKQAILASAFNEEAFSRWGPGILEDFVTDGLVGLVRSKDQQSSAGTPYIRMNHFDMDGGWNETDLTFVKVSRDELDRYELRTDDVLFNTRNSYELVGKVAVWPLERAGYVYNNNILRLRFDKRIFPPFAGLLMMSPLFRNYLQTVKSATTSVCAIYQRSLMAAPFAVPSLDDQKTIARQVHNARRYIDRLAFEGRAARKLIDHLDQAILAKAFRGELVPQDPNDEPASLLLERIRAEREIKSSTKHPKIKKK